MVVKKNKLWSFKSFSFASLLGYFLYHLITLLKDGNLFHYRESCVLLIYPLVALKIVVMGNFLNSRSFKAWKSACSLLYIIFSTLSVGFLKGFLSISHLEKGAVVLYCFSLWIWALFISTVAFYFFTKRIGLKMTKKLDPPRYFIFSPFMFWLGACSVLLLFIVFVDFYPCFSWSSAKGGFIITLSLLSSGMSSSLCLKHEVTRFCASQKSKIPWIIIEGLAAFGRFYFFSTLCSCFYLFSLWGKSCFSFAVVNFFLTTFLMGLLFYDWGVTSSVKLLLPHVWRLDTFLSFMTLTFMCPPLLEMFGEEVFLLFHMIFVVSVVNTLRVIIIFSVKAASGFS